MEHNIQLKEWEINVILEALAEQPYNRVAATIQRIKDQIKSKEE